MNVDAFIPCFIDQFYPETAKNFIILLERAGCKVNYNPEQTCCGQPAFNSEYWEEAKTVGMKKNRSKKNEESGFQKENYFIL